MEPAIEDERTPGVVLDAILGGWPTVQHLWQMVAKHPNVTANVERWCRQKRSVKLNAALAASSGVSDGNGEAVSEVEIAAGYWRAPGERGAR